MTRIYMTQARTYLDYNATAPVLPEAAEAMARVLRQPCNASSVHGFGRAARQILDEARANIAAALHAEGAQIIFTATGTEANNLALRGFRDAQHLAVSAVEHPSVLKPAEDRKAAMIPVDGQGIVRLEALEALLKAASGKTLVSVMLANNETGVIQPIAEIAQLVYAHGGFLHMDASQACGKIPVDFNVLNVDMITVSGHKFGAPQGAAALIVKKGVHLSAQITGGGQESGYRAGTENVAAIAGFAKALEIVIPAQAGIHSESCTGGEMDSRLRGNDVEKLRDHLETQILTLAPEAIIFGKHAPRLLNTSCIALPGMNGETQLINFDLAGIAVSSGSACSSGRVAVSHVLLAMGVEKPLAECAIRVSLGRETTRDDIDRFLAVWKRNHEKTLLKKAA